MNVARRDVSPSVLYRTIFNVRTLNYKRWCHKRSFNFKVHVVSHIYICDTKICIWWVVTNDLNPEFLYNIP
jgi:hypothetical protein